MITHPVILLFGIVFSYHRIFVFLYEAEDWSFKFCEELCSILMGIALNLYIAFDRVAIFTVFILGSVQMGDIFIL